MSKDLQTQVSIGHISFSLFDRMNLEKMLIRDQNKDTLLYAATIKVRITDWFFLKDKIELQYIGVEDAIIKQQRKTPIWNYQFLVEYFSSPNDSSTKKKSIIIDFKKIDLKNVTYLKDDWWIGRKEIIKVGSLVLDAQKIDIATNKFLINTIELDKPVYATYHFEGLRPAPPPDTSRTKNTALYFNEADLFIHAKNIAITDGSFIDEREGIPNYLSFDGRHINFQKINGSLKNFLFLKDTICADINIAAKERSGLEINKLSTHFRLTPKIMEFDNLTLQTNKSEIKGYYAMHYSDFDRDLSDYVTNVGITAKLQNSTLHTNDIAYFAPDLRFWNRSIRLTGNFGGTVADFTANNLSLQFNNNYVVGNLQIKGLPDINRAHIAFTNGRLQTDYQDLLLFSPALKQLHSPDLKALGTIRFNGNFTGSVHHFKTTGTIHTSLGGLYTSLSMQLPKQGDAQYTGTIVTQQFNLGRFIREPSFGTISFNGNVSGNSFALDRMTTSLKGSINQLQFNGYNYTNLTVNGSFQKKYFRGEFKADDPNFDFTSSIEIDVNGQVPHFNILGDLVHSDLQKLKFTNEAFNLTGLLDLNFNGRNIDEFLGSAKILNAVLTHHNEQLAFDSLAIYSDYQNGNKILTAQSNEFDAVIQGSFNILQLPNSLQAFLSRYYPSLINPPQQKPLNQLFTVTLHTRSFDKYARLINPKLTGLSYASLTGAINTIDSGFTINADIPFVQYDKYTIENATIQGKGDLNTLNLTGAIANVHVSDSLNFPNTEFKIQSQNDHSSVHIAAQASNTLNEANMNADVYTLEDGLRVNFQPSSFIINDKKWTLENQGELVISRSFVSAQNIRFSQGQQQIVIETDEEEGGNTNNLVIKLNNLNLGDLTPLVTREPKIEGIASGQVYLKDFFGQFSIESSLTTEQFRLNDDSIGVVNLTASYNNATGRIAYTGLSNSDKFYFNLKGSFETKDSTGNPLDTEIELRNTRIGFLNQFLGSVFSDVQGLATGKIIMSGNFNSPQIEGVVNLTNASLTVNYTQVTYFIDSATIQFMEDGIDFGELSIHDKNNHTGLVRGHIFERGFKDMYYDLEISTDKLLVLNTKAKDNDQFYGQAIGRVTMSILGPEENLRMSISGEINDTTHITIPPTNHKESAEADFITFKKYGEELVPTENKNSSTKLSIDLDITATNKAQIDVILDDLTGDVIKATGAGRMRMRIEDNNVSINGRYVIESGSYDFNFQSFIRKPFLLIGGEENYIEWNGDPNNARINIEARYIAERVSLSDLLSSTAAQFEGAARGYRGDVYVIANLNGKLSEPKIDFRIDFPPNTALKNDNAFASFLTKLESDQTEMLKQVTYLIVFGSFAPYGEIRAGVDFRALSLNTISQVISNEINKVVSNLLFKITGDKSLQFDVGTSTYSSSSFFQSGVASSNNQLDRQRINLKINKSLLNDKVIVTVGGDLDFNVGNAAAATTGNFQWLPDISVQIMLSKDRKIRAIVFNKSSLDISQNNSIGRRNRQGVSLSYTRDFEKIFGKKEEESKASSIQTPTVKPD